MELQLAVEFIGLSMLTRRPTGDDTFMLLMPRTRGGHDPAVQGHVTPHRTVLFLGDARHTAPGTPLPAAKSLDGKVLRITDRSWNGQAPQLAGAVLDLPGRVGGAVRADAYGDDSGAQALLDARVEVRAGGAIRPADEETYTWLHQDGRPTGQQTTQNRLATWVITANADALSAEILDFGSGPGDGETIPLEELANANGTCVLQVFHVIDAEVPPRTPGPKQPGRPVEHFEALYLLLDGVTDRQQPLYAPDRGFGALGSLQGCPMTRAGILP